MFHMFWVQPGGIVRRGDDLKRVVFTHRSFWAVRVNALDTSKSSPSSSLGDSNRSVLGTEGGRGEGTIQGSEQGRLSGVFEFPARTS